MFSDRHCWPNQYQTSISCKHVWHTRCREFAQLVKDNAVAQLPESEFEIDPGLREMIEAQIKEEEDAVRQVQSARVQLVDVHTWLLNPACGCGHVYC